MLHLFTWWWLISLSCPPYLKSLPWCVTPWSISLSSKWNAAWFHESFTRSIYFKFEINLQIYLANFSFLMYQWQQWDLRGISDDIWRKGETAVVPTHPPSSLSFLPSVEVVTKLPGFELHPLCVCAPYLTGFPFRAGWVGWQIILPEANPIAC